jgi:Skp family chaperone for outer membrane proteins
MNRFVSRCALVVFALAALIPATGVMAQAASNPGTPAKKPTYVVVIDRARIIQESKVFKDIQDEYNAWEAGFKAQVQPKVELLRAKQRELGVGPENENQDPESKPKLSDPERAKLQKEIDQLKSEIDKLQVDGRKAYEEMQKAGSQRVMAALRQVIDKLAAEKGWEVVLNKDDLNVVWFINAVDQTEAVLAKMEKAPKAPATAAPSKDAKVGSATKPVPKS